MKKFIILISTIIFFLLGDMAFAANNYQPRTQKQQPMRTIVEREYEEDDYEYEEYVKPRNQYREPSNQYREPRNQYNYNNQRKQYNAPKYQTTSNQYKQFKKKPNMYFGLQFGVANACNVDFDNSDGYAPFNKSYNISAESGGTGGLVFGGWFKENVNNRREENITGRWEIELSGQSHELKKRKGTLSIGKIMFNIYFENKNDPTITPFFFGGIGFSGAGLDESTITQLTGIQFLEEPNWIAFAYQIGGGLAFPLSDRVIFDLSGKYFGSTKGKQKVKIIGGKDYEMKLKHKGNINVLGGIRFLF